MTQPGGGGEFSDGDVVRIQGIDSVAATTGGGGGVRRAPLAELEHGGLVCVRDETAAFATVSGVSADIRLGGAFGRPNDGLF